MISVSKRKAYLDTSVISALFDERNPERRLLTQEFFGQAESFEMYVSEVTLVEIGGTADPALREQMEEIAGSLSVLPLTSEVDGLADEYVRTGAIPESRREDASHIAIAVVHEMDFLVIWNFRHIVRRRTKHAVHWVNARNGLRQVEIATPAELL